MPTSFRCTDDLHGRAPLPTQFRHSLLPAPGHEPTSREFPLFMLFQFKSRRVYPRFFHDIALLQRKGQRRLIGTNTSTQEKTGENSIARFMSHSHSFDMVPRLFRDRNISLLLVCNPFAEYHHETTGPLGNPHGPGLFASVVQHVACTVVVKDLNALFWPEASGFFFPQTIR